MIDSKNAQKVIARIIYELGTLSPPKFVWFIILTEAGLKYHFSKQLLQGVNDTYISIKACSVGNYNLFINNINMHLLQNYCDKAYKHNHYDIKKYFDDYLDYKIISVCRYAKNVEDFSKDVLKNINKDKDALKALGKNGNKQLVKVVLNYQKNKNMIIYYKFIIFGACSKGHSKLFKYLIREYEKSEKIRICYEKTIEEATTIAVKKRQWHIYDFLYLL